MDKLKRQNNNMDAIRYVMAFSVLVAHLNILAGTDIWWPISSATGVGGFFTLSGFLIFHSYQRKPSVSHFLRSRALRILPPYFLIVTLCALTLVSVSSLPAAAYFTDPQFWKYLGANLLFLNFLEPSLPGVFATPDFVSPAVNGSLWTMKIEWCLYLTVPVTAFLIARLDRRAVSRFPVLTSRLKADLLILLVILLSIAYTLFFKHRYHATGAEIWNILSRQVFAQLSYFYTGVLAFRHLPLLLRRPWPILIALLAGLGVMQLSEVLHMALRPIVEGGLVIWLSMTGRWGRHFSRHDNVSYDIYLFHWPIIQIAVFLALPHAIDTLPVFWPPYMKDLMTLLLILTVTTLFSFLSWNLIGRPFQRLRHRPHSPLLTPNSSLLTPHSSLHVAASIVLHNTPLPQLRRCLASLAQCPCVTHVHLIDNSPVPLDLSPLLTPHSSLLAPPCSCTHVENRGYGAGHNIAIRKTLDDPARPIAHLVLNADTYFDGDILTPMLAYMAAHPDTGIMMPKVYYPDGDLQLTARRLPTPFDLIAKRFLPTPLTRRHMRRYLLAGIDHDRIIDSPYLLGSFLLIRTDALRAEGLFDERFFMYPEDIDITRRIHRDWRTIHYPEVSIIHHHAAASRRDPRMLRIHIANMIRYFNKWGWFIDPERRRFNRRLDRTAPRLAPGTTPPPSRG